MKKKTFGYQTIHLFSSLPQKNAEVTPMKVGILQVSVLQRKTIIGHFII